MIEWPTPWPADIADVAELKHVAARAKAEQIRIQLVTTDRTSSNDRRLLSCYRPRLREGFAGYSPTEINCRAEHAVEAAISLLDDAGDAPPAGTKDVLICTHGRRDVCCGADGTRLYHEASALLADSGVRLWRSSHQGGHRFAPTALVLPTGTSWGRINAAALQQVVRENGSADEVIGFYRGGTWSPDPRVQLLDGVGLQHVGWEWLSGRRVAQSDSDPVVQIRRTAPDGTVTTLSGVVATRQPMVVPPCRGAGRELIEDQWSVEAFALRPSATA